MGRVEGKRVVYSSGRLEDSFFVDPFPGDFGRRASDRCVARSLAGLQADGLRFGGRMRRRRWIWMGFGVLNTGSVTHFVYIPCG
jgi:hypothetical protein